jgi:hypothetical protein
MSKLTSLQNYLVTTGESLTANQIRSMFKIANPTAAVRELRLRGVCVYANRSTLVDGTPTTRYRAGNASRDLVAFATAAGYFNQ